MIKIDGSKGEGGGQVLRTSLSLSMLTGQPFEMNKIRAGRRKPGLMRQHLACVRAAQEICGAEVTGDEIHSQKLVFKPKTIKAGDYQFAVGSAGSAGLVLQTVLPALMLADEASRVKVSGGTHNPLAPNTDFLMDSFFPLLRQMGLDVDLKLNSHGFMPVGGGELEARIGAFKKIKALDLMSIKELSDQVEVEVLLSSVEAAVGEKQRQLLMNKLNLPRDKVKVTKIANPVGPGNAVLARVPNQFMTLVFSAFGMKNLSSRHVIGELKTQLLDYQKSPALIDEYLADQLMIPLAFAGGSYRATKISLHSETNKEVIETFLQARIELNQESPNNVIFSCVITHDLS